MKFANAYCNVPVYGASRASMLTGMLPTENRFLAGYLPPFYIHPIFIGIAIILILQIIFKSRISGLILGIIFFLINLYFLGALLSEFIEFNEFNNRAKQLLFAGITIWIVNFTLSLTMIYKYTTNSFISNPKMKLEKQSIYKI